MPVRYTVQRSGARVTTPSLTLSPVILALAMMPPLQPPHTPLLDSLYQRDMSTSSPSSTCGPIPPMKQLTSIFRA